MKFKILTFLVVVAIFAPTISFGQITTTKVASKTDQIANTSYDSTRNFLSKDVNQYLGQVLYLNGKAESLRKYGYEGFLIDFTKDKYTNKSNIYKCCENYNSKYDELVGKYFKVLEVNKHPKLLENEYLYGKKFYLKLQENESEDIVYYEYDSEFEHSFPFIVVGFFENLKKKALGNKFVFGKTNLRFGNDEADVQKGKIIEFELGEEWECFDVTIEEKYYRLSLLLKDNDEQVLAINYEMAIGSKKFHDVFTKEEANAYKTKFGLEIWHTILQGKVWIGMTQEMCRLSWGEPKNINQTTTSNKKTEQWVYSDNYLYFDNGILTAIQ